MTDPKLLAARAALDYLPEGGLLGLGTGSTAKLFIDEIGALVASGRKYEGVATSQASRVQAESLGITVHDDVGPWDILVCVDGADEVSASLDLIKGGGAAHTREKIVNGASRFNVIVVDESKLSAQLGERWPVPLEVLPFGSGATRRLLSKLGEPKLRERDGQPVRTDAGNLVVDLHVGPIADPAALDTAIRALPGVVETGLFVQRADVVLVAGPNGVRKLVRTR